MKINDSTERSRKWRERLKEDPIKYQEFLQKQREYREKNRKRILEQQIEWKERNRNRLREEAKERRELDKEAFNEGIAKWRRDNPEKWKEIQERSRNKKKDDGISELESCRRRFYNTRNWS